MQKSVRILSNGSVSTFALVAMLGVSGSAWAETTDSSGGQVSEIVVTASKLSSATIQNTPIAVQALSGADLKAQGALDFIDYFRSIPGLAAQDEGPGDKRYVIRGINSAGAATVGLYLDEVIVTGENSQDGSGQALDIKLFDIDRVEVLKGPQGTTFGSSSMAGAIRYITTKPNLNDFGGYLQSSLRATDGADLGVQTDGAVNIVVVPGKLALRASGFYATLPGWIDNRFEKGANNENDSAGRLAARWNITDGLTLDVMAMYQRVHQDAKNYYNTIGYDGLPLTGSRYQQADYARAPYLDRSQIYNATLNYKRDFGTVTATTSSFIRDNDFERDSSLAIATFLGLPYDGAGRSIIGQPRHREVDTAELRFASSFNGPFQMLVGAFGQDETRFFRSYIRTVGGNGLPDAASTYLLNRTVDTRIQERAAFGEISYQLTHSLTFTAGARVFDINIAEVADAITNFGGGAGSGAGPKLKSEDRGVVPRYNLAYKFNDNINAYIQVAKGFRSGGTNDQTAAAIAHVVIPAGYKSDSLWNYEVGLKTALIDRKLFFDTAIYYIDWSQIQTANQATNGQLSFPYTGNGGRAAVKGAELTLDYRPIHGLELTASTNYSSAQLTIDNPIAATGLKGNYVPYVPKWTGSVGATYRFPIDALGVDGVIGGDVSYQGSNATEFNSTIANYHQLKSYELVNLRAGVNKGPWSLMIDVSNVFNDNTVINYNNIVVGVYPDGFYSNHPRTISLSASRKF